MRNKSIKVGALAISMLVLAGCQVPFVNKATSMIQEKAGQAVGQIANQVNQMNQTQPQNAGGSEPTAAQGNTPSVPSQPSSGSTTNPDECLKGCAVLNGTGMFSKTFCEDSCWAAVAKDTGDDSICDTKVDPKNDLVLFACHMNVAEKTMDTKYCDKIGKDMSDLMRAGCYGSVAKAKKDPSVCEAIKGNMLYTSCVQDAGKAN
jgi:outer membrane murein-binding lipoprotein Lpp